MIREAGPDDLLTLFDLEKAASTAAYGHTFPDSATFPDDEVLSRWVLVLEDPAIQVLIDWDPGRPVGYAAFSRDWLHHFALLPVCWGTGRAQRLHDAALRAMRAQGAAAAHLWVLVDNGRARAFYSREGWVDTGEREPATLPPHPSRMRLTRTLSRDHPPAGSAAE
ncbi:MAG: GNAT family N-acetyltransferase [Nocardioidaceae bacterium]